MDSFIFDKIKVIISFPNQALVDCYAKTFMRKEGFFIIALQSTSAWLEKLILTLVL